MLFMKLLVERKACDEYMSWCTCLRPLKRTSTGNLSHCCWQVLKIPGLSQDLLVPFELSWHWYFRIPRHPHCGGGGWRGGGGGMHMHVHAYVWMHRWYIFSCTPVLRECMCMPLCVKQYRCAVCVHGLWFWPTSAGSMCNVFWMRLNSLPLMFVFLCNN